MLLGVCDSISAAISACHESNFARRLMWSIARKRPALTSHVRGFAGTPSIGHRSIAATNASCTASSAPSKSPSSRTSVARTRRESDRSVLSTASRARAEASVIAAQPLSAVEYHDGPYFYRAELGAWNSGGNLQRVVQILGFDQIVSAELLLGFGERTVGGDGLPVANTYRGGRRRRLERVAPDEVAARLDVFAERIVLSHHLAHLVLRHLWPDG